LRFSYTIFLLLLIYLALASCSAEKTNIISVSYHNTTARYNAYFIAKERINEIESSIKQSQDNNYDAILNIIPPLDSAISVAYSSQIEDAIKKASIAIQNHPNSKWVDDSYNLIGLARLYGYDHTHAIETFKYVNTNSNDQDARHFALINLMRTFIEYDEMGNAIAVSDYLEKEDLNKTNMKRLYIMRAWYYQNMEDYNNMVFNLDQATPHLTRKDNKARMFYIIGQTYQELGFEAEAFNNYKKCLASNPEYELSFYAKVNMAQVTQLASARDVKNVRKYFKKLVKDAKNAEFKDKIYFEWGQFEIKQGLLDEAMAMYNMSIRESINNPRQKGRSYLKLAEIYYDSLRNYPLAKSYYDSTVQVLPQDQEGYEEIAARQRVLEEFVTNLLTIESQDSLLNLGKMDSLELLALIDEVILENELKEKEKEEKEKKQQQERSRQSNTFFEGSGISGSSSTWYFNNPSAIAIGQSEFKKIWGNRPLEDNWRRSQKIQQDVFAETEDQGLEISDDEVADIGDEGTSSSKEGERLTMFAKIPRSESERNEALKKIEEAYYRLGNIYYFDLKERQNAIGAFETLIDRFPQTGYKPEALYQLYLIFMDDDPDKAEIVKNQLISVFPESTYALLITNPNYQQETLAVNEILKNEYETAYRLFLDQDYEACTTIIDEAINTYPNGNFLPNLILLKILVAGKTLDLYEYQLQLGEFIEQYPESDVTDYANTLLIASDTYKNSLIKLKEAEYSVIPKDLHYFIVVFESGQEGADKLTVEIDSFNNSFFSTEGLKTGILKLDATHSIIMVDQFDGQDNALLYHDLFKAEQKIISEYPSLKFDNFVISKSNFTVLYETKELDNYKKFYTAHY
jgi:tetratricopeptide (TPR) repeat protein